MRTFATFILLLLTTANVLSAAASADTLSIAGNPVEITVSQISQRTICIELSPIDNQGRVRPSPPSTVLVSFPRDEKLRIRDLTESKVLPIGHYTLTIKPQPLTFSFTRASGQLVQECVVDSKDGSIVFHTDSPVFGLGEGRQQFDRRGFFYNFVNGQATLLPTNGATLPVPFLIGSDGWSMFIHNPPPPSSNPREANLPWGQFDLRGDNAGPPPPNNTPASALLTPPATLPTRGQFIPRRQTMNQAPIQLYLSVLDEPADALTEYTLLTGHPVMPPKWVMGYMQSHRSLENADEPLQIAKEFRDKQLPCDAVIYLGSGYTNDNDGLSGWNTGHGSLRFNPRIFPKPQETIDALHVLNFKIILHKNAAPARLYGNSVDEQSADPLHIRNYWETHVPLMKMGVDGWWPDDGDELSIESRLAPIPFNGA